MKANEWERLRKTPEAVALRSAAVAWVAREGGEVGSDVRLLDAAIALATVASRSGESPTRNGRARKLLADLAHEVSRFEGFELLFNDAIRERDALKSKTSKRARGR